MDLNKASDGKYQLPGIPKWGKGASWEMQVKSPRGNVYWVAKDFTPEQLKAAAEIMDREEGLYEVQSPEECSQHWGPGDHTFMFDILGSSAPMESKEFQNAYGLNRSNEEVFKGYLPQWQETTYADTGDIWVSLDEMHIDVSKDCTMGVATSIQSIIMNRKVDGQRWIEYYRQTDTHKKFDGIWRMAWTHMSTALYSTNMMTGCKQPQFYDRDGYLRPEFNEKNLPVKRIKSIKTVNDLK